MDRVCQGSKRITSLFKKIVFFCIQLFNFGLLFQDSELGPINRPGDHRYSANVREQPPNGLGQSGVLPLQQESKLFRREPRRHYFFHLHLLVADCWNKICRLLYILLYLEQYSVKNEIQLVSKASKYTKEILQDPQSCLESFKSFRAKSFSNYRNVVNYPVYLNCNEQLKGKRLPSFLIQFPPLNSFCTFMQCDLWISKFKKEQFPRKLYEELRYMVTL